MSALQRAASPDAVREALERALAERGFHPEESWITRLGEAVRELLASLGLESVSVDERLLLLVLVLVAVLLGVALLRVAARAARRRAATPARDEARARRALASELFAAAEAARAGGDLRGALRLFWTALVVGLGERGRLDYREAWTNRELLARGALDPAVAGELEPLLASIEAQEYGRAEVVPADVERLREECRARGVAPGAGGAAG